MSKVILSINAGSSSVKVSVFSYADKEPKQLAEIQISGLTAPPAKLTYSRGDENVKDQELSDIKNSQDAYEYILKHLIDDKGLSELNSPDDIEFACHRVVHGGDYSKPTRIDKDTYHHLEALSDLAPLHNAGALEIVKAVHAKCPNTTNVAFFDSAYHQTIPPEAYTYAIDPKRAAKNKLRKYGFHGLSYAFILKACVWHLRSWENETNLIALHLGSGASICCIKGGKSVDTSMGLTPLAGLPGATRSGDVDPSLIFHFTHEAGKPAPGSTKELHITQAEQILNKESGWKAMTGTTDFGEITKRAFEGDAACKLAFDVFVDRIVGYIGSYFVKLNGDVNAVVFAGGIGEKGWQLREAVSAKIKFLGFSPDLKGNENPGKGTVVDVGNPGAEHRLLLCRTDEQLEMARECLEVADEIRKR
ncbi:Acetokinase family-domain-containing protein [Neohortaea acidophila]|uniref:Probable acetate kinase n=1 Tax=Neohortaea acidophila TaxID=245834 RepID=A0A6A6PNR7_9PEZI|nr:Acetokinase family-domain-containing protein [Neohortaea acidophila]KAF2481719.1 Acetokinase family-domain-containing protein [Neohortaea acidophila]